MQEKRRNRSGPTQPESARKAKQVLLRLPDDARERLDALAEAWGTTRSGAVARLVEATRPPAE